MTPRTEASRVHKYVDQNTRIVRAKNFEQRSKLLCDWMGEFTAVCGEFNPHKNGVESLWARRNGVYGWDMGERCWVFYYHCVARAFDSLIYIHRPTGIAGLLKPPLFWL